MKKNSVKAVLNMSKLSVAAKIKRAKLIVDSIAANTSKFTSPNPPLAIVNSAIADLEIAWKAAEDGGKTKTAIMHDKEAELMKLMFDVAAYVQNVANGNEAIIHLAALDVKKFSNPPQTEFSVERGENHGEVIVKTKALRGACYVWQYSPDPVSKASWIVYSQNMFSKVTITGLNPGFVYWFRVIIINNKGVHETNMPLSIMVV